MCASAFFPPGLHPVLDGGEGDEDAVIAPQVPTGRLIRQAVLHHQPHGQGDDAVGVVALGQGQVRHVGVEVGVALGAVVLRVGELDVARPLKHQVAQVVQRPLDGPTAIATPTARRTWSPQIVATALDP